MKTFLSAALVAGAVLCGASLGTNAAPLTSAPIEAQSNVEAVHGFHRDCRRGHRNVRRGIVSCGSSYYYQDRAPSFGIYIGPERRGYSQRSYRGDRHVSRGDRGGGHVNRGGGNRGGGSRGNHR